MATPAAAASPLTRQGKDMQGKHMHDMDMHGMDGDLAFARRLFVFRMSLTAPQLLRICHLPP